MLSVRPRSERRVDLVYLEVTVMRTKVIKAMLVTTLLGFHLLAAAEDIDLFVGAPTVATDLPNVLIIVDNTANWNTAFDNEMEALKSVVNGLPADTFRLGLMMFTETGGGNSGNNGAYVRAAIRQLTSANKVLYQDLVESIDKGDDKSNGGKAGLAMEEAYLYYSAGTPYAGNGKNKTDYAGNISGTDASQAIYALAGNALTEKDGSTYNNPVVSGCAKNFIIYISNGAAQDNNSDTQQATTALNAVGGSTATIPLSPSGSQDNMADEWARFMKHTSSLGIATYTVDVDKVTTGQGPGWTALMKSMAKVGGGKYFDVTSTGTEIADALKTIFSEIQSVNSVFASVSLPVSVNTQGTHLNQVYVGMFRPDPQSLPRWAGNLKQYKLGVVDDDIKLLDADDDRAINSQTGFITECVRSFWTPSSVDSYWSFNPLGDCLTVANSDASNYPDGNVVEKGAQGYLLRSTTPALRSVKTCDPVFADCTSLTDFNTSNAAITSTLLGAADATERDALINWARGADVDDERATDYDEEEDPNSADSMRPSVHGDVVHSRPVAINYGTDADPEVVVFYGGNDGVLRAVNGNRTETIGTVAPGAELWSFLPPEFYANIKRIRANSPAISYPGSTTAGAVPKTYGFDGPVTAHVDADNGDYWIYGVLRRGGRAVYAFDVSDLDAPALKWKRGCPNANDDVDCSAGFTDIGQTWPSPKVVHAANHAGPLLMFGGGYDPCEDDDPHTCAASNKGNNIYVLDADTGALLQTFTTERGVIGDVTVVPDSSGLARYVYAADLDGNVYRISGADANTAIGSTAPGSWTMTKIAALGCDTGETPCNRKFMFAPDVVVDGSTHYLLLGSGDREKPLASYTNAAGVDNYFFMLKDQPTSTTWLTDENAACGANVICRGSLVLIEADEDSPPQSEVDAAKGWYLELASAEQVVTSAITVLGVTTFSTHEPAVATPGQCTNLGTARVYNVEYGRAQSVDGDSRYQVVAGGGLPPSPVAGMVVLDDGTLAPFLIGGSEDSPLEGGFPSLPPSSVVQPRAKVYWNIEQ
jgi:type IV pilus assembly protein PilY1